jgi:argininosuccinate lyase
VKDPGAHSDSPHSSPESFPAPVYAETVLAVNFEDAKKYFLDALLEIHSAHVLMLTRQSIIPTTDARLCLEAIARLDRPKILAARYDGRCEDLFFHVQDLLVEACGEEVAGKIHTARSRNDIDLTMYRMCLRREILEIAAETADARKVLLDLAAAHLGPVSQKLPRPSPCWPSIWESWCRTCSYGARKSLVFCA